MIQGIIESKKLPPFTEKPRYVRTDKLQETNFITKTPRMPVSRYKYLHQSITLMSHGCPAFTSALQGVKEIHDRFERQFPEGMLEARTEDSLGDAYMESIDLSNRYLTPASEAGRLNSVPFQPGVDSKGIFSAWHEGMGHVHISTWRKTKFSITQLTETALDIGGA